MTADTLSRRRLDLMDFPWAQDALSKAMEIIPKKLKALDQSDKESIGVIQFIDKVSKEEEIPDGIVARALWKLVDNGTIVLDGYLVHVALD